MFKAFGIDEHSHVERRSILHSYGMHGYASCLLRVEMSEQARAPLSHACNPVSICRQWTLTKRDCTFLQVVNLHSLISRTNWTLQWQPKIMQGQLGYVTPSKMPCTMIPWQFFMPIRSSIRRLPSAASRRWTVVGERAYTYNAVIQDWA